MTFDNGDMHRHFRVSLFLVRIGQRETIRATQV